MLPARPTRLPGPLGLLLPPVAPATGRSPDLPTASATGDRTFGTTSWVTSLCRQAEAAGADGLWASDHLFWSGPTLECLTTLSVAAAVTQRPLVGSCVLQLPLRAPVAVAKQVASLQVLSGGRAVLGVGVGSHRGEYARAGVDFATRGRRLDDGIGAVLAAWRTAGDEAYAMTPAAPAPLWIGGSGPAARRRVATVGDCWVPLFVSPAELAEGMADIRHEAAACGRDPESVRAAAVLVATVDTDPARGAERGAAWLSTLYRLPPKAFARHLVAGPPARCAEAAQGYLDAGADHVVVMMADDRAVEGFAEVRAALGPPAPLTAPPPRREDAAVPAVVLSGVGA